MNRIYTRTGDGGTTGIHGGTRVPKDDIRIEANGCLDELNCIIGVIRSMGCPAKPEPSAAADGFLPSEHFSASEVKTRSCGAGDDWDEVLHGIQRNLMSVMSLVATPAAEREKNPNVLPDNLVAEIEARMDAMTETIGPGLHFLLPGGTPLAARLQLARAVCRRAERFVMARCELASQQWPEERWQAFAYKNQK